ncbi:UvrD-helicase domain-containing protein [Desulfosarcina sp. OttesenSCG-928-A07]|nr:UvrD-helicase domain-containing protein [Desulfosarcina sp. OttesenSCG-928-G17]MDL2329835.1 UvrD-helicase domain-containing protein [Desulfosarcina sp. OttesenSCG-928-A07]
MSVLIPLDALSQVDLSCHALIEASAGTGKTYTLENLVVRLLASASDLSIENILLVTFTEKAVSELKIRIRQRIEAAIAHDDPAMGDAKPLQAALDSFDNAAIFTIHGFCYTLLREFPFETGALFEQEPVDDGPLMDKWMRRQVRTQWPVRYGDHLDMLLRLSGFSDSPDAFIKKTIRIARQVTGDSNTEVWVPQEAAKDPDELWKILQTRIVAVKSLMGDPPDLAHRYDRLNIHANTRKSMITQVIAPLQAILTEIDPDDPSLDAVFRLADLLKTQSDRITSLVPEKWLKAGENLDACPGLSDIQARLLHLREIFVSLSCLLMRQSIETLREDVEAEKAENGWISYQDMLGRVAAFVGRKDAGPGIDAIRDRYRVAFVDEFQDTDEVQWRIFKTLFLDGGNTRFNNRLFLIGDPKQAIYGFRGADVFTYLSARQEMIQLADQGKAQLYSLSTNWRSLPELVTVFNLLFSTPQWFGPDIGKDPFAISYTPALSPPPDLFPAALSGQSLQAPFVVADLTDHSEAAQAKSALAGFICREIRHLVDASDVCIQDRDGTVRKPGFGDMAILVRSQSEFFQMEKVLLEWQIPYAYYRQPGLFQSVHAHWLALVLRAVARPEDTGLFNIALLTPFFDVPPEALVRMTELPADHPIRQLMRRWFYLGETRQWGALFQSLTADSGLWLRHCTDPGWERMETNFQQIFDHLIVSAHAQNLDLAGMADLLDRLREKNENPDPDADLHQIADEGDKVRILTLHVSKGLEFPIVFVAGGLTRPAQDRIPVYHEKNPDPTHPGFRKVIDLSGETGVEAAKKEAEDEDRRLFYVALTRARFRLYLPYFPQTGKHHWVGPICRFVAESVDAARPLLEAAKGVDWKMVHDTIKPRAPVPAPQTVVDIQRFQGPWLFEDQDYTARKLSLASFSSLSREISRFSGGLEPAPFHLSGVFRREDDEPAFAAWPDLAETAAELPGGARMGSLFHYLFENMDFDRVMTGPKDILAHAPHAALVDDALARFRIDPMWRFQIAESVAAVLRTPIDLDGRTLVLGKLSPDQRQHEVAFFFPAPQGDGKAPYGHTTIRGFMDLLFEWRGKFYIADWKSNRLADGYGTAAMEREMAEAGYDLQYQIYTVAALRWLKKVRGTRFDPERHFGGVLYFFIRGMKPGSGEGVFHVPPERLLPLAALEEKIHTLLAGLSP